MPQRVSGKRYAQAVFELAREQQAVEQFGQELALVAEVFADAQFNALLKSADVPAAGKRQAVDEVLAAVSPSVRHMVQLLTARGLVDAIPEACREFEALLDAHLGRQRIEITTAVALTPEETERIRRFVAGLVRSEVALTARVRDHFGSFLRPAAIEKQFELRRPIFRKTAAYGHFGRDEFPWEKLDQLAKLK